MRHLFLYGPYDGEVVEVAPGMNQVVVFEHTGVVARYEPDRVSQPCDHIKQIGYEKVELRDGIAQHFVYVPVDCKESVMGRLIALASKQRG